MKKTVALAFSLIYALVLFAGCSPVGDKGASLSLVYAAVALLSLLLLICYCCLIRKKDVWVLLLFVSVLVVNAGYFCLSVSRTLEEALLANRISYLGSAMLPLSMLMVILHVTGTKTGRLQPALLFAVSIGVFFVAASPGYLDIYYKEVSIETVNGITVLNKVYGPWHRLYMFYLLFYFGAMVAAVIYAIVKNKMFSKVHAIILAAAVFVNILVWLIGQLVKLDFEYLSVSYIFSELFLLGLHLMQEEKQQPAALAGLPPEETRAGTEAEAAPAEEAGEARDQQLELFREGLETLTQTERVIYGFYTEGTSTKEIMSRLNIKENTLKYHNKNIYGKLGVSSRKQLVAMAEKLGRQPNI